MTRSVFIQSLLRILSRSSPHAAASSNSPQAVLLGLCASSSHAAHAGFLPQIILSSVSALVALRRIAGFLAHSEVGGVDPDFSTDVTPGLVSIKNASFVWDKDSDRDVTLRDINLECKPGQLTMIVGAVGCGKSSLLATLFRQITRLSGSVAVGGRIAYVPQTAWIMNETVRENVLMGSPMDETRCAPCCTFVKVVHYTVDGSAPASTTTSPQSGLHRDRHARAHSDVCCCGRLASHPHLGYGRSDTDRAAWRPAGTSARSQRHSLRRT